MVEVYQQLLSRHPVKAVDGDGLGSLFGCFFFGVLAFGLMAIGCSVHGWAQESGLDFRRQVSRPFVELADRLEDSGRSEAALATRAWIPLERSDWIIAYHAEVDFEIHDSSLREPKVRAAFLDARREASRIAWEGALAAAREGEGVQAYTRLWRALREDPTSGVVRKLLGLPAGRIGRVTVRPGTQAPQPLRWPDRSFLIAQSENFRVYSVASKRETLALAEDLQAFFDIWSQVFLAHWINPEEVCRRIIEGQPIRPGGRVEVACFADRATYVRAISSGLPAASLSTGFYSPQQKLTLLFAGKEADAETRYHEVCHQLLQEMGQRVVGDPGREAGFWLIEGIASYVESLRFSEGYAVLGGWESSRLQYARARWLPQRDPPPLIEMIDQGRDDVQQREDLAAWYTTAAAYTHYWMDHVERRDAILGYLSDVYAGRTQTNLLREQIQEGDSAAKLVEFLELRGVAKLPPLPPKAQLKVLCLSRTSRSTDDIRALAPQPGLRWLDLSFLPVTDAIVETLVGDGDRLERVNLEQTLVADGVGKVMARQRRLEEFDASFTALGDEGLQGLAKLRDLETLWLTGTRLTDAGLPFLLSLRSLVALDVQRTSLSTDSLEKIKVARPDLQLNPLQLLSAPSEEERP